MPSALVDRLREAVGLPVPVCEILVRRGRGGPDEARAFLRPAFDALHSPDLLPDMAAALDRVDRAIARGELILVHGDYDADGLCSAALLTLGLRELGARVEPFVPHRLRDGYDLGDGGLARARDLGAGLIITADCGVSAVEAVAEAGRMGLDVVVTDHHRPSPRLPDAVAVVDPARSDAGYPFQGLAGVGVAFKLLSGLYARGGVSQDGLNRHLDLVALGTVADLVPLLDENRILVRAGLGALSRTRKPGLRALASAAGVDLGGSPGATDIGYRLAPRLNAAGRVGAAETGLRLLLADEPGEAERLASVVEMHNRERRQEDRRVRAEAEAQLVERYDPERDRSVLLWGEDWHPGVIGIVASRLVEQVHRPVILVSLREEPGRGSGRSIPGFHLHRALEACSDLLERFGGHRMAAGLEVRRERLEALALRFEEEAARTLTAEALQPDLQLDLSLPLRNVDEDLWRGLEYLAPFGTDNPRPVLHVRDVRFERSATVGSDGDHLKAILAGDDDSRLEAIGFGMGGRLGEASSSRVEVAFELSRDRYRGRERLQARMLDFRPVVGP
ncbi:MAG: single-stranded-DNA-specific exonuclease RecJ [Candidatus Palauibacterales bacterium]|nr:single-stranded-DNA-specific exonuclease RecJ [Candidatus Palauibacterales bacterium]MDP2582882.1 single-stranded-DNA-specific exonuclease RecJ [Candidatus Palauibacterales bacterium]